MTGLTREIVLKSIQGFKVANAIHEKERLSQLQRLTIPESIRVFETLYNDFRYIESASGGDNALLNNRRIQSAVDLRDKFSEAFRRSSLDQ